MRIKFYIPFGGFYDSIHSDRIDYEIDEQAYPSDENVDWDKTKEDYCREYLNLINVELNLRLKFEGIWSPKYYNFETDKIDASIDEGDWKNWRKELLKNNELREYIEENSKSRDGFTSFYSGWDEVIANDEIFLEYIFSYYHSLPQFQDDILEYHSFELVFENTLPKEFIPKNQIL